MGSSDKMIDTDDISGYPVGGGSWIVKAFCGSLMFFYVKAVDETGTMECIGFRLFGGSGGYLGGSRYFLLPDHNYLLVSRDQVPDEVLRVFDREFKDASTT